MESQRNVQADPSRDIDPAVDPWVQPAPPPPTATVVAVTPVVEQPHVQAAGIRDDRRSTSEVVTGSDVRVSPGGIAAAIVGVGLMLWGAIVVARAGLDSPLDEPVVDVLRLSGTAVLGIVAVAAGVLLTVAGLARHRPSVLFVAIVVAVAGFTLAVEPEVGNDVLGAERDFGIAVAIAAGIVVLIASVVPDVVRRGRRVERSTI